MATQGFKKAVKGLKPLRLVIGGPSGSGKSKTSLIFAKYLEGVTGKPTAAIDTEHGRLSLYADEFSFDVIEVEPPFHPKRLIGLIHDAEEAGYGQLVIDSSTHFYAGTGGLLEIVQEAAKNRFNGNSYYAWAEGTPLHNSLIDTILRSPMHIIITGRSKQKYMEQEKNGKKYYEKAGEDMVQRDGLEYEFDFCLMMDMEHTARVSKGLNEVDTSVYFKEPGEEAIRQIMEALQKDSVKKVDVKSIKQEIGTIFASATEENKEKFKALFEKTNPNKETDVDKMVALLNEMKQITNNKVMEAN